MNFDIGENHLTYNDAECLIGDVMQEALNADLILSMKDDNYINLDNSCSLHDQDQWYSMVEQSEELTLPSHEEKEIDDILESLDNLVSEPEAILSLTKNPNGVVVMEDDILCTNGEINNILDECAHSLVNEIDTSDLLDEAGNIDFLLMGKHEEANKLVEQREDYGNDSNSLCIYDNVNLDTFEYNDDKNVSCKGFNQQDHQFVDESKTHRDFSRFTDEEVRSLLEIDANGTSRGRPEEPFPLKLHKIIELAEVEGYSSIISWLPHGRAFRIHNQNRFVELILPKYFFQSRFTSFQRQINIYGFRKLCRGADQGAYCNEFFLRGRPGLCIGIRRLKKKPVFDSYFEPNFYNMPTLPKANNISSKNTRQIYYASVPANDRNKNISSENDDNHRSTSREQSSDESECLSLNATDTVGTGEVGRPSDEILSISDIDVLPPLTVSNVDVPTEKLQNNTNNGNKGLKSSSIMMPQFHPGINYIDTPNVKKSPEVSDSKVVEPEKVVKNSSINGSKISISSSRGGIPLHSFQVNGLIPTLGKKAVRSRPSMKSVQPHPKRRTLLSNGVQQSLAVSQVPGQYSYLHNQQSRPRESYLMRRLFKQL